MGWSIRKTLRIIKEERNIEESGDYYEENSSNIKLMLYGCCMFTYKSYCSYKAAFDIADILVIYWLWDAFRIHDEQARNGYTISKRLSYSLWLTACLCSCSKHYLFEKYNWSLYNEFNDGNATIFLCLANWPFVPE